MSVEVGQIAPDFQLFSDENESFQLSGNQDRNTLLLFFPGAFTSVCTTELNAVNNDLPAFDETDTQVVGVSTDSPFVLAEFKKLHGFDFPLLSDHNAEVSAQYGTKYEVGGAFPMNLHRISKRAAFVVDKSGQVRYAEILENAGNQPDFDAIQETLQSLD